MTEIYEKCEGCNDRGYHRQYLNGIVLCFNCYEIALRLRNGEEDE